MAGIEWGNAPDWVGAIGTAGALILGMVVLRRDGLARREETRRLAAQDEDRRREQASNVSGLVVEERADRAEGPGPIVSLKAIAHNASSRPIYKVVGLVYDVLTKEAVRSVGFIDVLPGNHSSDKDILDLIPLTGGLDTNHFELLLTFTDSNGVRWTRTRDGSLKPGLAE